MSLKKDFQIPIPTYEPANQISTNDNEVGSYDQPHLFTVSRERTRVLHERLRVTGQSPHLPSEGLEWTIDNLPMQVGKTIDAHGIAGKTDPVQELHDLLTQGISSERTLYTMPLLRDQEQAGAFGAEKPRTDGGIIVTAGPFEKLRENGIKSVILGEAFVNSVKVFQDHYPKVNFFPWHQAPEIFTFEYNQQTGEEIRMKPFSDQAPPNYTHVNLKLPSRISSPLLPPIDPSSPSDIEW